MLKMGTGNKDGTGPGRLRRLLRGARARDGAVLSEFALIVPMLVLILIGGLEIGRYILLNQKLSRLSTNISDLVSRTEAISVTEIDQIFEAAEYITNPFQIGTAGMMIVTSVGTTGPQPPMVNWQRSSPNALMGAESVLGKPGDPATLPRGFTLREDQDVIIAEVLYDYQPFFGMVSSKQRLYSFAVHRPRFGPLTVLEP